MREIAQKDFSFTFGPITDPVAEIEPGEVITLAVPDAFGGKITTDQDKIPDEVNPLGGPIYVAGAQEGDALAIDVNQIELTADQGVSLLENDAGLLGDILLFQERESRVRIVAVRNNEVSPPHMSACSIPCEPNIGCIGTSPRTETIRSDYSGPHGGNLDTPYVSVGSRVFLPVSVPGALLSFGDVHAIQSSGELFALDISAKVTLTINLVKQKKITWPRIETADHLISVACGSQIRDAVWIAFKELLRWISEEYRISTWDAYQLCSQVVVIELAKIVPPAPTVTVKIARRYLPQASH